MSDILIKTKERVNIMKTNFNAFDQVTHDLIASDNAEKKVIIDSIQEIIKPHLYRSKFRTKPKLMPNGEYESESIQLVQLPDKIQIPGILSNVDRILSYYVDDQGGCSARFIRMSGLLLSADKGAFSDFYGHSQVTLKVILSQLISMKSKLNK